MTAEQLRERSIKSWVVRRERENSKRLQNMKTKGFWKIFIERWWEEDQENRKLLVGAKSIQDLQHVYFIQDGVEGPIKIGRSYDVHLRLKVLQPSFPRDLRLRAIIPNGGYFVESTLHKHFASYKTLWRMVLTTR